MSDDDRNHCPLADSTTRCPSEEELAGFVMDEPSEETAWIADCVTRCERCRAWVTEAKEADGLMDTLRRVMDADSKPMHTTVRLDPKTPRTDTASRLDVHSPAPDAPQIEGYQILSELGRGGMGVVYKAIQLSTKRIVALKVLIEGPFASTRAKRRFEREVELAAQLDHPNIVTILESGITSGRHYFAMRYVDGRRLDQYIAQRNLTINEKLRLFVEICRAVNYAHQRGVIHRDLKPSNIYVDKTDHVQIMDFGLAKIIETTEADRDETQLSLTGQIMGTLPYMSPEQVTARPEDVDVRTDVYALAVVLYEMLTGQYPYAVVGQMVDVLRNIAEAEPARPSTLNRMIGNEVETILLTALAKERARRYQTAEQFARDVERFLVGDPIEAKRDSSTYVLKKLLWRHRRIASVAAVIAVMAITSGLLAWQNKLQRDEALAEAVVAGFVERPGQALDEWRLIGDGVKQRIAAMSERHVQSAAYTQRIMGARSSWVAQPDAFWTSVEGGPLWENGEWLELADWPAPLPDALVQQIIDQVLNGSPNQQYAALCLMGQLDVDPALAQKAGEEVLEESEHPGVLSAAVWALRRSGLDANYPPTHVSIPDPLTGLVFVQIPANNAFQRGAEPDDPDQLPDEHREGDPVTITSFYLATTELTFAAIEPFLSDAELADEMTPLRSPLQAVSPDERDRIAAGWISLDAARAYCERLNERAIAENLPYRYRLPSEDEWEYACRAGNDGRFCYGDREEYLHYFARSRGEAVSYHRVAEHMPNAYGVFDMHGGLWERCDSPYPAAFVNEPQHQGEELFVHRGGAYYSPARRCRSTQRNYGEADSVDQYVGVRLVLEKGAP